MNIKLTSGKVTLIIFMHDNLKKLGLDQDWLTKDMKGDGLILN